MLLLWHGQVGVLSVTSEPSFDDLFAAARVWILLGIGVAYHLPFAVGLLDHTITGKALSDHTIGSGIVSGIFFLGGIFAFLIQKHQKKLNAGVEN